MKKGISFGIPELIILLGLGLVFISGFLPGEKKSEKGIPLLYQEVGTIGGAGFSYRHISLGKGFLISKGVEGTPIFEEKGPIEIAKGILTTEEHVAEFSISSLSEISEAKLEASIADTNKFGPLIIYLNGEEVWKGYKDKGEKLEVKLPIDVLRNKNTLKITCGSSGWRIWAPAFYVLKDVKITETLSTGSSVVLNFSVSPEDLANFYLARFYTALDTKLPGEMAIILNDEKIIYQGVPNQKIFMVPFSSGIKENNKLEIKLLGDGSYEFKYPEIVILTQKNATAGVFFQLKIPEDYLYKMKRNELVGRIEIEVEKSGETPLSVILSSEREIEIYKGIPPQGKLVLEFTGNEVSTDNTIILRSGSIYDIGYIKVELVKK